MIQREDVLADRSRESVVLERGLDPLVEVAEDLELRPLFSGRVDDVPRRGCAVSVLQVLLEDIQVFLVVLVLMQVVPVDSPAGVLVSHQGVQPPFLLFLADVEEELHDQVAVVGERALGRVDAADPLFVDGVVQIVFHQSCGHFIHPIGVEESELAGFRDLQKIPVQEGIALLFRSRGFHCPDFEEARVDAPDDPSDDAALAC